MELMYRTAFMIISISETLIFLVIALLTGNMFLNYSKKKRLPLLYLAEGFLFLALGILINLLAYLAGYRSNDATTLSNYVITSFAILYFTLNFSNIFIYAFIESVFFNENKQRMFLIAFLEGIALGLIVTRVKLLPAVDKWNPIIMAYHHILSFIIYGMLTYLCFKEVFRTKTKKVRYGLGFIGTFAVIQMFAFLVLFKGLMYYYANAELDALYLLVFTVVELLAAIFGYLGYTMPKWLVNILKLES